MKRYIYNVWLTLMGRDPYREELDGLKEKMERAGENVASLQEQLYAALNWWDGTKLQLAERSKQCDETSRLLHQNIELLAERDKQVASLQALVENLRERIKEKGTLIGEYQQQIDELTKNQKQQ